MKLAIVFTILYNLSLYGFLQDLKPYKNTYIGMLVNSEASFDDLYLYVDFAKENKIRMNIILDINNTDRTYAIKYFKNKMYIEPGLLWKK